MPDEWSKVYVVLVDPGDGGGYRAGFSPVRAFFNERAADQHAEARRQRPAHLATDDYWYPPHEVKVVTVPVGDKPSGGPLSEVSVPPSS